MKLNKTQQSQLKELGGKLEELKTILPELFEKSKPRNGWFTNKHNANWLGYAKDEKYIYGIDGYGNWFSEEIRSVAHHNISQADYPATQPEIFETLKAEAIKRGLWDVPVNCLVGGGNGQHKGCYSVMYDTTLNQLWSSYGCVFQDGIWATPYKEGFKAGDIVVLESNDRNSEKPEIWSNNTNVPIGVPLKIKEARLGSSIGDAFWLWFEGYPELGITSNQARKATEKEVDYFNRVAK